MADKKVVIPEDMGKSIVFGQDKKWNVKHDGSLTIKDDGALSVVAQGGGLDCDAMKNLPVREFQKGDSILLVGENGCARYGNVNTLFADVKVGLVTDKGQANEDEPVKFIFTVSNSGTAAASPVTLKIQRPNIVSSGANKTAYSDMAIEKTKAGSVTKVTDTEYQITNLEPGGVVTLVMTATFSMKMSYGVTGVIEMPDTVIDLSKDDNRASAQVHITATRDDTYQPTQNCPALVVKDKATAKALMLFPYGSATRNTSLNEYQIEGSGVPSLLERLNIYADGTRSITLNVPNAGTATVHSALMQKWETGMTYNSRTIYALVDDDKSTAMDKDGKRYLLKPYTEIKERPTTTGPGSTLTRSTPSMFSTGINLDLITSQINNSANIKIEKNGDDFTISNIPAIGCLMAVSFRPAGSRCQWQTVMISVPRDVTDLAVEGLRITRTSGTESHVNIISSAPARNSRFTTGWNNIDGKVDGNAVFVPMNSTISDRARINAPAGVAATYTFSVRNGKLDPNSRSTGNVKVEPSADGTSITVNILSTATAADSFIYRNNGAEFAISVGGGLK